MSDAQTELDGYRKANALLLAGMGSLTERYDEVKHDSRRLRALVVALAERVHLQSELLSRTAEKKNPTEADR